MSLYEVLEISASASPEEVKQAYKRQALVFILLFSHISKCGRSGILIDAKNQMLHTVFKKLDMLTAVSQCFVYIFDVSSSG